MFPRCANKTKHDLCITWQIWHKSLIKAESRICLFVRRSWVSGKKSRTRSDRALGGTVREKASSLNPQPRTAVSVSFRSEGLSLSWQTAMDKLKLMNLRRQCWAPLISWITSFLFGRLTLGSQGNNIWIRVKSLLLYIAWGQDATLKVIVGKPAWWLRTSSLSMLHNLWQLNRWTAWDLVVINLITYKQNSEVPMLIREFWFVCYNDKQTNS